MKIFRRESFRGSAVITLEIESLDSSNAQCASQILANAMRGETKIVVDLGALRYFDVKGFAEILKWASVDGEGPEVRLCSRSPAIQALFELLGASPVVPLFQSRDEAMASFQYSETPRRRPMKVLPRREEDPLLN